MRSVCPLMGWFGGSFWGFWGAGGIVEEVLGGFVGAGGIVEEVWGVFGGGGRGESGGAGGIVLGFYGCFGFWCWGGGVCCYFWVFFRNGVLLVVVSEVVGVAGKL